MVTLILAIILGVVVLARIGYMLAPAAIRIWSRRKDAKRD